MKISRIGSAVGAAAVCTAVMAPMAPAQADPLVPIDWKVDATTTMKKLNQTVVVPQGSFKGNFDLGTSTLSGDMTLPAATKRIDLGPLPLANVTFKMTQAKQVTGTVKDVNGTLQADTTATINVQLVKVSPVFAPWLNLVGNQCMTSTPVVAKLSGPVNLFGKTTFKGTYALPKFKNCGLSTWAINLVVPGEGNTMSATFYP